MKLSYYSLGRSLRLQSADLKAIREAYPSEFDAEQALEDMLLLWLHQKYNVERFGPPTWRMLVEAVDKKSGGNNHDLAKEIASNHPAGRLVIPTVLVFLVLVYVYDNVSITQAQTPTCTVNSWLHSASGYYTTENI